MDIKAKESRAIKGISAVKRTEVLLSPGCGAAYSLLPTGLNSEHPRLFSVDVFKSNLQWISNLKKTGRLHIGNIVVKKQYKEEKYQVGTSFWVESKAIRYGIVEQFLEELIIYFKNRTMASGAVK